MDLQPQHQEHVKQVVIRASYGGYDGGIALKCLCLDVC